MVNFDYLYNKEYYGSILNRDFHLKKKLGCEILANATVLPNDLSIVTGLGWGGGGGGN